MERCRARDLLFALTMFGGCLQQSSIDCDNGGVCPAEFRCASVHDLLSDLPNKNKEVCVPPSCAVNIKQGECVNPPSHEGCSSRCSQELPIWTTSEHAPQRRFGYAMAYDAARGRLVLFGGKLSDTSSSSSACSASSDDSSTATWEWDGAIWHRRTPLTEPPEHKGHVMAYDAFHERVVMFGGDTTGRGSTWEWDGSNWSEQTPVTAPPARLTDAAMAYDAGRRRVVLFGGDNGVHDFKDLTWEWNGANWHQINTTASPSARAASAMTYDSKRGKIVLFGGIVAAGRNEVSPLSDTWEFDGTSWVQVSTTSSPEPRGHVAMTFDATRGKVVMFGGATEAQPNAFFTDTWEWDGSQWTTNATNATNVAPQMVAPMAYDIVHGRVVLIGGSLATGDSQLTNDTWERDGEVWAKRAVGCGSSGSMDAASMLPDRPPPRSHQAMAYVASRASTVMFGGRRGGTYLNDTWLWSGADWRMQAATGSPPPRAEHAMAFDAVRNVTVMFGGTDADPSDPGTITRFDDTWEWDGTSWTQQFPATRPMARRGHAMVYDAARNTVLLIGGNASDAPRLEQCEWDGVSWTCSTPASSPPTRTDFAVTYDVERHCVVLFGGRGPFELKDDTWEWDGSTWTNRSPAIAPRPRAGHTLAYDAMRHHVVLFGGQTESSSLHDVWEWDGKSWTKVVQASGPSGRHHAAMVYDVARESLVMFGGADDTTAELGDSWFFRYEDPAAPDEECHTGLDYDGDGLAGCDDPDCMGLCALCRNGVCDVSEDCGLCPQDCGVCGSVCGDLQCDLGETHSSCPGDCLPPPMCGDGFCDPQETCYGCPQDCRACPKNPGLRSE